MQAKLSAIQAQFDALQKRNAEQAKEIEVLRAQVAGLQPLPPAAPVLTKVAEDAMHALATVHYNHMGVTFADVERCWKAAHEVYLALHPDDASQTRAEPAHPPP